MTNATRVNFDIDQITVGHDRVNFQGLTARYEYSIIFFYFFLESHTPEPRRVMLLAAVRAGPAMISFLVRQFISDRFF